MLTIFAVLSVVGLLVILASSEERAEVYYPRGKGRCQRCSYDLSGLPDSAPCPECGSAHPGAPRNRRPRTVIPGKVLARLAVVWGVAFAAHALLWRLVEAAHRWSYALQQRRYDPVVIGNAMRARGFDLDWESALVPLGAALVFCSACCLLGSTAQFRRTLLWGSLLGWTASVCWLFLQTYLVYG